MDGISRVGRAVKALIFAAGISLCGAVFAEEDAAVAPAVQEEAAMADEQDMQAVSAVPEAATQGDAAAADKDAKKPEKKGKEADASIPSANPEDANKHAAWRKREANKVKTDLPNIRRSMMQQGNQ